MTDHYKAAERYLREAEKSWTKAVSGELEPVEEQRALTVTHYSLSLANAHSVLAQIGVHSGLVPSVGKMADAVVADAENNRKKQKENA